MRKALLSLAAIATVAAAATPALAQPYRGDGDYGNFNQRQERIERQIERGVRNGQLDRREAINLRQDLRQIERLERRYRYNGLQRWERNDLEQRMDRLERRLRWERRDDDRRGDWDRGRDNRGY